MIVYLLNLCVIIENKHEEKMNLKNIFNFKRKQKPTPEIREILNLENHSLITFNIIDADVIVKRRRKKH